MDSAARTSEEERAGKSTLQSMHAPPQISDELDIEIQQISQGMSDLVIGNGSTSGQESVMERIASKTDTAAAVILQFAQSSAFEENQWNFAKNVLGVVACIGSVRFDGLSRILAHYLGEHQMLGLVCKSLDEGFRLVNNGSLGNFTGLDALAAHLGMPVPKSYHVYCIENIWPYTGSVSNDFRRELLFPSPVLPSGECPPGFVGYAVNMIELGAKFRTWRTASGHGLRETLLYHLFGELQVYESRDSMWCSRSCITKDGAVSLDEAILRGNGVASLVHGDVDIQFPICNPQEEGLKDALPGVNGELVRSTT